MSDLVLYNGRITTLDPAAPEATAVAISGGRVAQTGSDREVLAAAPDDAKRIDLDGRRVVPGLNDSHTHLIRGGLSYNMELRWEGVPSLADALAMVRAQADRTPRPSGYA
jgi:predicted amidohydrolase YtcJ